MENEWEALIGIMGGFIPKSSVGRGWIKQYLKEIMVDTLWRRFYPPTSTRAKRVK